MCMHVYTFIQLTMYIQLTLIRMYIQLTRTGVMGLNVLGLFGGGIAPTVCMYVCMYVCMDGCTGVMGI
jgi:hypothetical protein